MKLEIEENTLVFSDVFNGIVIKTPMGRFGVAQRDDGLEVVFEDPKTKCASTVFTSHGLDSNSAYALEAGVQGPELPERVPAYIDGPRAGKGARIPRGTVSREEFSKALIAYWKHDGRQQIDDLLREGFSVQELQGLLGHEPTSWIEDKSEEHPLAGNGSFPVVEYTSELALEFKDKR